MHRLEAVRGNVELVVLRPPTLQHLRDLLAAARAEGVPFQVVHFDGHGVLAGRPAGGAGWGPLMFQGPGPQGVLVFEKPGGGADHVPAGAVAAGRRRLAERSDRPSPKGPMPLADWAVPVHYARRDVRFAGLRTERRAEVSLDAMLDQLRVRGDDGSQDALAPVGRFVGRDDLFYTLEVAARLQHVVVLHGPGGTGKTELAKAFGRWWRDTGGVDQPHWVIWHSFEPGVASFGLDGLVDAIGTHVFDVRFSRLDPAEKRRLVTAVLTDHRLMLILDNLESVHSMPDPAAPTPPLGTGEREQLKAFLGDLAAAGPAGAVLITSRSPEHWLGDVRRVEVGGLTAGEAIEYADVLLAPYPDAMRRRAHRSFAELMQWLDGHPLSMRLTLPHLNTTDPQTLLAALHGGTPLPGGDDGGRLTSLPACIAYSFTHLEPEHQRALPVVALFHGVADAQVLALLSQVDGVPDQFREITAEAWGLILDRAAAVGLLTPLGAGMYRIHSALPAFLAARWRANDPDSYHTQTELTRSALLQAYAAFGRWLANQIRSGDAGLAFAILAAHWRTMGTQLGYAIEYGRWPEALAIAVPLRSFWDVQGLSEEARAWTDRVRLAVETADGTVPDLDTPAGALWLFLVGEQANSQISAGQLDLAERTYREILQTLQQQPGSPQQQRRLYVSYHQLGRVAQERGNLDDAEDWYRQSMTILQELAGELGMDAVDRAWRTATGRPLPPAVRDYLQSKETS